MNKLAVPFLVPFLGLAFLWGLSAQAIPHKVPMAQTRAETAMHHLYALLADARTMRYTCTFTPPDYSVLPTKTVSQKDLAMTIQGVLEKPNKLHLEFSQNGQPLALLVSDGRTQYFYYDRTRQYIKYTLGSGSDLLEQVVREPQSPGSLATTVFSLVPMLPQTQTYLAFFQKDPLFPPLDRLQLMPSVESSNPISMGTTVYTTRYMSAAFVLYRGKPALRIIGRYVPEKQGSEKGKGHLPADAGGMECYLDPISGLLRCYLADGPHFGPMKDESREDYSELQLGKSALPASTFAWTPPSGATLFQAAPKP